MYFFSSGSSGKCVPVGGIEKEHGFWQNNENQKQHFLPERNHFSNLLYHIQGIRQYKLKKYFLEKGKNIVFLCVSL